MGVDVDGARVLVTGASSGIGYATAEAFAAAGATVAVTARRADRLRMLVDSLKGDGHLGIPGDLNDVDHVEDIAFAAWEALGHLDVVVHNAAIPKRRHVSVLTRDELDETMRVNFTAPARMALALLPRMLDRGSGSQVFVSSLGGRIPIGRESAYCASKAALCGFAEAMAVDLFGSGVDVRLVLPGPIDTEIWDQPGNDPAAYEGPLEPPSMVADAIVAAVQGDAFETYAPDMKGVVEWKVGDPDGYISAIGQLEKERKP